MYRIIFLFVIIPLAGFSQTIELDPVSITAGVSPQKVSRTGRNILMIKGEEFNKLPVHSLDELLKYLPGIEVQMRGPMGAQSDIVIRGGTFQQVLIILDGVRLNDPNTGHFNSYIPITPSEIDRVEILKGASSAIYGSDAVGGVIQVFSKTFVASLDKLATNSGTGVKEVAAMVTAGQYGLVNVNAGAVFSGKKDIFSAGVLTNNAEGQQQRGTTGYFYNNTASVSATHFFNENFKISLRSSFDSRKFSAQNFYTTFTSDTAKETVQTFWNQLSLVYQKQKNRLVFNAGYKNVKDVYAFNSAGAPNKNISTLSQATAQYEHSVSVNTNIITGAQFQNKSIASNDRGDHTIQQAAAFIILNQNFKDHFFIAPAVRIDNENGSTALVPQINLSYKMQNVQLRGSAGKTIRQANFTERYNNYNKSFVASGSIGNPDLDPERSFSYEAGADYFGKKVKVGVTVFRREQKDVIDYTPTPYADMPRKVNLSPTGTYALATNIATVNTTGAEADIQLHSKYFFSTLGIVWLNSNANQAIPSFYISSHAKFLINYNLRYEARWGSVSINGVYKERKPQSASALFADISKSYFLMNAMLNVNVVKNKLFAFIEADNLLNKTYSDLLGSFMPGRWIMGGVKCNLF